MEKSLRDALAARSKALGFDSIQAMIRVWAKAQADGRTIDFDAEPWPEPPQEVADRFDRELAEHKKLESQGKVRGYTDVGDLMKDLLSDEDN